MRKRLLYLFLGILLICLIGGWFVFSKWIRPNHYQLLRPYTVSTGEMLTSTGTRLGKNGSLQILIPAGTAIVGKDGYQEVITLPDYWIDQRPVTIRDYKECFQQGQCDWPHYRGEYEKYFSSFIYRWLPVTFVSWLQAESYCEQMGGHLPTEAQWEKATRGPDGIVTLWADDDDALKDYRMANLDLFYSFLTPSGWLPQSAGPYGLLDTAGNVREWVIDVYQGDDAAVQQGGWTDLVLDRYENVPRILKGGSFLDDTAHVRFTARDAHEANSPGLNRGFRCAFEE